MADFAVDYKKFLDEFEKLTDKRAVTLKNKGQEAGIKKLKTLFKSGKTLEQRFADYDKAKAETNKIGALVDKKQTSKAQGILKDMEVAYDKMNEGIKLNIKSYEAQSASLGGADKELKTGFSVFIDRLEQLRKRGKMELETKKQYAATEFKTVVEPDAKLAGAIKVTYLTILKGVAESEALLKVFVSKPTEESFLKAFSAESGPRTMSTAVTNWKQTVLKLDPGINDRLGADPEELLTHIKEITQKKPRDYWDAQYQLSAPGLATRAKPLAVATVAQLKNWATLARQMKALM